MEKYSKEEFKLSNYNYRVLEVRDLHYSREWTILMPILVVENEKDVKLVFFEIGRPYYTTIKSVHMLYDYRPYSYHNFQFTSQQHHNVNSNENQNELISFIDSGSNSMKCGGLSHSENVVSCDLTIYHNQEILIDTTISTKNKATCTFNISSIKSVSEDKYELQFPFDVVTGNESQFIKLKDRKLNTKSDIKINEASTEIFLNDKFDGPVLLYDYKEQGGTNLNEKVIFNKHFEPELFTQQLMT